LAAIEYAVVELGIEDLIVCGHTCCGAMQALVKSADATGPSRTPLVANWLRHADATLEIVREHYQHLQGQALFNAAAEENVLVQLEHLRSLPVVASRISSGRVRLHGWMYKIDSGEVFYYESEVGQFVKFGEATADSGARLAGARSNPG
jgi:carbonic anhydrase